MPKTEPKPPGRPATGRRAYIHASVPPELGAWWDSMPEGERSRVLREALTFYRERLHPAEIQALRALRASGLLRFELP